MTDAVEIALIGAAVAALPTILAFVNQVSIRRIERHTAATKTAMQQLEKNTNHKMDQLLEVTGKSERAIGKLEGAAEAAASPELPATVRRQETSE